MPKLNFVILCDNAFIAQGTNSLNIISIFDRISAKTFPATYHRLVVVSNMSGNPGTYFQEITIRNRQTDQEIAKVSQNLIINNPGQKAQFIGNFLGVIFPNAGEYLIEVAINGIKQDLNTSLYVE